MSQPVRAVVSHRFAVSVERVYDAWLDPEWIGRWMHGPAVREGRIVRLDLEPRVGGKFSFVIERQGVEVDHFGEYLELDRPGLLVFTWTTRNSRPAASRIIVEIVPHDDGCDLTLTHVMAADSAAFVDKAAAAWRTMLSALATALAEKTNPLILKAS
jgi:uncharacterized protein YndB with AHSA1/START domain